MALAAIEVYNKPNFPDREQVFSILMVSAWESLVKARLLKDARNCLPVLYVKEGRRYKRNRRTGLPITIDFLTALDRCAVPDVVRTNLHHLYDVRNAATHLTVPAKDLSLLVYSLGAAALKNYAQLCEDWFGIHLNRYNFYILPLGFSYPFTTLSAVDLSTEPDDVATIIKAVVEDEEQQLEQDGFFLTCKLEIVLLSAKKVTGNTDLVAKIDSGAGTRVIRRNVALLDQYPHSFTDAAKRISELNPSINRTDIQNFVKQQNIKGDPRYSAYNYRNRKERERGPSRSTSLLYNDDFIRLCVTSIVPAPRHPMTAFLALKRRN
jgi:hypothetical protein